MKTKIKQLLINLHPTGEISTSTNIDKGDLEIMVKPLEVTIFRIINRIDELRVNKQEAINHYLEQRKMLEDRMSAIAQSDDKQLFIITKDVR